jgi:HSP20 family protein
VVLADVPGVRREDLDVRIAGDELLIDASVAGREEAESRLPWGYERRFRISSTIDRERIRAKLEDGVLRVELGKVGAGEARHVDVD